MTVRSLVLKAMKKQVGQNPDCSTKQLVRDAEKFLVDKVGVEMAAKITHSKRSLAKTVTNERKNEKRRRGAVDEGELSEKTITFSVDDNESIPEVQIWQRKLEAGEDFVPCTTIRQCEYLDQALQKPDTIVHADGTFMCAGPDFYQNYSLVVQEFFNYNDQHGKPMRARAIYPVYSAHMSGKSEKKYDKGIYSYFVFA